MCWPAPGCCRWSRWALTLRGWRWSGWWGCHPAPQSPSRPAGPTRRSSQSPCGSGSCSNKMFSTSFRNNSWTLQECQQVLQYGPMKPDVSQDYRREMSGFDPGTASSAIWRVNHFETKLPLFRHRISVKKDFFHKCDFNLNRRMVWFMRSRACDNLFA